MRRGPHRPNRDEVRPISRTLAALLLRAGSTDWISYRAVMLSSWSDSASLFRNSRHAAQPEKRASARPGMAGASQPPQFVGIGPRTRQAKWPIFGGESREAVPLSACDTR